MIDNSIPYIPVVMRREPGLALPAWPLPEGFSYQMYQPGLEKDWARIEAAAGEFECEMEALLYYQKAFLPYSEELPRRCIFIKAPDGELVGTATAWWDYNGQRRHPLVHFVAVKPNYQGKGLGKAITAEVIRLMDAVDGDSVFFLCTQTTSHKAIRIYERAGFYITNEKGVLGRPNDQYQEAIDLLASLCNM